MKKTFQNMIPFAVISLSVIFIIPSTHARAVSEPPGPRGEVGPDVPLSQHEKMLFSNPIRVDGFTADAIQAACNTAAKMSTLSRRVVFLPAGKYIFEKTVNVPGGIIIFGEGSKTCCLAKTRNTHLFKVTGDHVRFTRLKLQGADTTISTKNNSYGIIVSGVKNVRIDHCELLGFSYATTFNNEAVAMVDHCKIHHNLRDGLGYGVAIYSGAKVLICDNEFWQNRHSLASNGALDWSSPKRLGRYIHKKGFDKTHWEFIHNRVGSNNLSHYELCAVDTHPGMDGSFVVEANIFENFRHAIGIRDGTGIIRKNLFRKPAGKPWRPLIGISIAYGKHNGIPVENAMPHDIEIAENTFIDIPKKFKKYSIGKAENIYIEGKLVPETKSDKKWQLTPANMPRIELTKSGTLRVRKNQDRRISMQKKDKVTSKVLNGAADAVPDDHVISFSFKVTNYPSFEDLAKEFQRYHKKSEKIRNADGSWGKGYGDLVKPPIHHPLIRDTARRVIGYIDAYLATGEEIYKQRAKEGLEYLLKEQQPDGQFIWWYGDPKKGRLGGGASLYVTGIPTVAFLKGYKLFKDKRYLAAANKACDYLCTVSNDSNANYNLFASWALATNYKITGKKSYLKRAIEFALYAINKKGSGYQLPSGGWSDSHNQAIWYHGIILRGLATLLAAMPKDEPNYTKIRKATYKALNHLINRQLPDGKMLFKPHYKRAGWRVSFAAQALAIVATHLGWDVKDAVRLAAKGIVHGHQNPRGMRDERGDYTMAIGSLMQAYKKIEQTKVSK